MPTDASDREAVMVSYRPLLHVVVELIGQIQKTAQMGLYGALSVFVTYRSFYRFRVGSFLTFYAYTMTRQNIRLYNHGEGVIIRGQV